MLGTKDLWQRYEIYLDEFELEQDKGFIDEDEEPMTYDDFCDEYYGSIED